MTITWSVVRIDDAITLGGRQTTLRKEHQRGKVAFVRGKIGVRNDQQLPEYWAVLRNDDETEARFRISQKDFKALSVR